MKFDGILLDIEGTTSSIRFVYDVMFPYARKHLAGFLMQNWNESAVQQAVEQVIADAGFASSSDYFSAVDSVDSVEQQNQIAAELLRLMDQDVKATGLKQVQGLVWESGFQSGEMVSHVYDDVVPALEKWKLSGVDIKIYSSGSVVAQKLFFGHTANGDLTSFFSGHFDTTIGGKKESDSYQKIADSFSCLAEKILFVSDVPEELRAASSIGYQTALSIRPGNAPIAQSDCEPWTRITSFDQIGR